MKTEELNYELPTELIAQEPAKVRSESRLMVLDRRTGEVRHERFSAVSGHFRRGDVLVFNDTKVLQARFYGCRETGAKLEGLFICEEAEGKWKVMLKGGRKVKVGERIVLVKGEAEYRPRLVEKRADGHYVLEFDGGEGAFAILGKIGYPPLPPYIKRGRDEGQAEVDRQRYQTVFAQREGAVAAPTAGLHFTEEMIGRLKEMGVECVYVTLHVGAGTFKPVTAERLEDHEIHAEWYEVSEQAAEAIRRAKREGRRVIAVGTTSVRTLESAARESGEVCAGSAETRLFIWPGFEYRVVDGMVTNFHLPKSTLIALVAAFAGLENVIGAYRQAVRERYRFYSYGDAMLVI